MTLKYSPLVIAWILLPYQLSTSSVWAETIPIELNMHQQQKQHFPIRMLVPKRHSSSPSADVAESIDTSAWSVPSLTIKYRNQHGRLVAKSKVKRPSSNAWNNGSTKHLHSQIALRPVQDRSLMASVMTKKSLKSYLTQPKIPTFSSLFDVASDYFNIRKPSLSSVSVVQIEDDTIDTEILQSISEPFVLKSVWSQIAGNEFDRPHVRDALVATGLKLTESIQSDSEWITWKQQPNKSKDNNDAEANKSSLETSNTSQDISVYIGRCAKPSPELYYGSNLPILKTRARIIGMSAHDIASLLMDSSRVIQYNQWSLGRMDVRTILCGEGDRQLHQAKIVRHRTQPPLTSQPMVSTTFLHARPIPDVSGAYVVVSRAVPDLGVSTTSNRSEILLGVNRLEPCPHDSNSCLMTSVTHVYSPALPAVLATRVGMHSAVGFVEDLRRLARGHDKAE
jgi:hypothetical protein